MDGIGGGGVVSQTVLINRQSYQGCLEFYDFRIKQPALFLKIETPASGYRLNLN